MCEERKQNYVAVLTELFKKQELPQVTCLSGASGASGVQLGKSDKGGRQRVIRMRFESDKQRANNAHER